MGCQHFEDAPPYRLRAGSIRTQQVFRAGMPKVLFALPEAFVFGTPLFEDVTADGQRFLLNLPVQARTMRELPRRVRVAWLLTCLVTM